MARSAVARFKHISFDISIIMLSILVAVMLVKTGVIDDMLHSSAEYGHIGSFVAGMFFTSAFTTAPSIAVLGEVSKTQGILETALWASLGSVIGDMLIFRFVRDRMVLHLSELIPQKKRRHRFFKLFKLRMFRYLTFLVGGLIIASPLPDELGISMLGLSKMKQVYFVPLSFAFNFLGICVIGLYAASHM